MKIRKGHHIPVYEHLEHYVRKTTYTQRLQWLEDANEFVRSLKKKKVIKS